MTRWLIGKRGRVKVEGVHKKKSKGREYHALRGVPGSTFWRTGDSEHPDDYLRAYLAEREKHDLRREISVPNLVDQWIDSPEVQRTAERTQQDYRKWALRFASKFSDLPPIGLQSPKFRGHVLKWRDKWAHSPKQSDYAVTVAVMFLNWLVDRSEIDSHNCHKIRKLYSGDRAEIIITPAQVEAFNDIAPAPAWRAFNAALHTGLRAGDLIRLERDHFTGPDNRLLVIKTNKRGRVARIPVSPVLKKIYDDTPPRRDLILVTEKGRPFGTSRLSQYVKGWMRRAEFPEEIALTDTRGTAATNLILQGKPLAEVAKHMGWSLRYAQNVIDRYVEIAPDIGDQIVTKLTDSENETG